jgi:hypothetical protein
MLIADTLVVLGLATASLGTIREADGPVERTFWLRNAGTAAVTLQQGYTSCGCTTIVSPNRGRLEGAVIGPGDSSSVTLRFNPRGKSGEFEEVGTITYRSEKGKVKSEKVKHVNLTLEGTCISSEESLLRQFPIRINDHLRLSTNRFDLGIMHVGESKERNVIILHRERNDLQERIPITFSADAKSPKGLQHIVYPIKTRYKGKVTTVNITLDVIIK